VAKGQERHLTHVMPALTKSTTPGWLKAIPFLLGLCLSGTPVASLAETYQATARIERGDIAAAREEAIRDILWEAGLQGGSLVQSKAALIQNDTIQSTMVRSHFHLGKFQITHEEILPDRIRITAIVEKRDAPSDVCDGAFPMRNIKFEWRGVQGGGGNEDLQQSGLAFGQSLGLALRQEIPPYLLPIGSSSQEAVYRISAHLEASGSGLGFIMPEQAIRIQVWAPTRTLVKDIILPIGSPRLASRESHDLGYAALRKWGLTPEARTILNTIKNRLAEEIRCLPAIARIPETGPDGSFSITTDAARLAGRQAIVFFASNWPVTPDGGVDLMMVDGHLQPQWQGGGTLHFPGGRRLPGRNYPAAGGYLIFQ